MDFEQFLDEVSRALDEQGNDAGSTALSGWMIVLRQNCSLLGKAESPLSRDLALEMARAVALEGHEALEWADTHSEKEMLRGKFHVALKLICDKATEQGVSIKIEEVDNFLATARTDGADTE